MTTHYKIVNIQNLPPVKPKWQSKVNSVEERWTKCTHQYEKNTTCKCNILYETQNLVPTISNHSNSFFDAFLQAYNHHQDIILSPDDVWLLIVMHFSKYVNDNAEQLRPLLVNHDGKKQLSVTSDKERDESDWGEFMTLIIEAIKLNTKNGVVDILKCDFTTTGPIEGFMSTLAVMDSFKKYFDYERCIPDCGINNVRFMGTLADWQNLLLKVSSLQSYAVTDTWYAYIKNIVPVIQQFIDTYQGKVDVEFWNKIMNLKDGTQGSGSTTYISGWILNFFGRYGETIETADIPAYSFDVPVKIVNYATLETKNVSLIGGFHGLMVDNGAYRPSLSMIIFHDGNSEPIAIGSE